MRCPSPNSPPPHSRRTTFHWLLWSAGWLGLCSLGCSFDSRKEPVPPPPPTDSPLLMSVASSAQGVLQELAGSFQKRRQIEVMINPAATSTLVKQILEGAPVDLCLTANRDWAEKLATAGLVQEMQPLLTNQLVLIVPRDNPAGIHDPRQLVSPRVTRVALAGEQVPAGLYADQVLRKLGLFEELKRANKIARGHDVRSALRYVERGEAEAGIVYASDLLNTTGVTAVHTFDPALFDDITYMLVLLKRSPEHRAAHTFYEFLQSAAADAAYTQAGFQRWSAPASVQRASTP